MSGGERGRAPSRGRVGGGLPAVGRGLQRATAAPPTGVSGDANPATANGTPCPGPAHVALSSSPAPSAATAVWTRRSCSSPPGPGVPGPGSRWGAGLSPLPPSAASPSSLRGSTAASAGGVHPAVCTPAALPPASLWTYCVHFQGWGPGEARGVCFLLRCPLHRRVAPCPGQCSESRPRSPAGARGGGDQAHLEQSPGAARPHALPRFPHCAVPGSPGAVCLGWGLFLSCLDVLGSESLEK